MLIFIVYIVIYNFRKNLEISEKYMNFYIYYKFVLFYSFSKK